MTEVELSTYDQLLGLHECAKIDLLSFPLPITKKDLRILLSPLNKLSINAV